MKSGAGLAMALMAAAVILAPDARAQEPAREKCFGVALAGQNDGIGRDAVPGGATVDYQGTAWVWVQRGSCMTKALPVQPDGTPRRGALDPLKRDRP